MDTSQVIYDHFDSLTDTQVQQFDDLRGLYEEWNAQINVISRKDMEHFYTRHVLHSLGIAAIVRFRESANILDVGTGGGFPGIPLAILYPEVNFHLVDSIGKKIKVVEEVAKALELNNVKATHTRVEQVTDEYDFVVSRAVTQMPVFMQWVRNKVARESYHELENGVLYLKGGDLREELKKFKRKRIFALDELLDDPFFETKALVHIPVAR